MTDANPDYLPRDPGPSLLCHRDLVERVEEAIRVCKRYNALSTSADGEQLAGKILKILEGE